MLAKKHALAWRVQTKKLRIMKPFAQKSGKQVTSNFSASLSPINHVRSSTFGLMERLCCAGLIATMLMMMRLFLAK